MRWMMDGACRLGPRGWWMNVARRWAVWLVTGVRRPCVFPPRVTQSVMECKVGVMEVEDRPVMTIS